MMPFAVACLVALAGRAVPPAIGQEVPAPDISASPAPATRPAAADIPEATAAALARQRANRFVELVRAGGLGAAMSGDNAMTIFAPTDAAFEQLPAPVAEALQRGDPRVVRRLLSGHLAWGRFEYTRIGPSAAVRVLAGNVQFMNKQASDWSFAGAHVIFGDQPAAGQTLIHFIDKVLLPPRWDVVDVNEIVTDSTIAISGPTGGLLHAATCPLGGAAGAPAGGAAATTGPAREAQKWEKPKPPTGPRGGGWETVAGGEPNYVAGDQPKAPPGGPGEPPPAAPASPGAAAPMATPPANGAAAGNGATSAACTCGLLVPATPGSP